MAKPREEWGDYKLFQMIHSFLGGALYHWTDRAHIESIRRHGLLSRYEANAREVSPERPGGNALTRALDAQRGLEDYVFLGLHSNGLMPKNEDRSRAPQMVYVNPQVIFWDGVKVALGRSTRSGIYNAKRAYWEMDWEILAKPELRSDLSAPIHGPARWKTFLDYEVLVPKCIPPEFLVIEGEGQQLSMSRRRGGYCHGSLPCVRRISF